MVESRRERDKSNTPPHESDSRVPDIMSTFLFPDRCRHQVGSDNRYNNQPGMEVLPISLIHINIFIKEIVNAIHSTCGNS